jgi:GAF domain-containing protein
VHEERRISGSEPGAFDERWLLAGLVVVIAALFLLSFFGNGGATGTVIRIFLLVVGLGLIYWLWSGGQEDQLQEESAETPAEPDMPFREITSMAAVQQEESFQFYNELTGFFENLIRMVRATFVAHSAVLFFKGTERGKLRIEFFDTQGEGLKKGALVDIEGSLPGSVFSSKRPVLEQSIPQEARAANYYARQVPVKSFLAVPVTVFGEVRGVLAVDSLAVQDFGDDDLELLKQYERLISQGILLLGVREKSQLIERVLKAQETFLHALNENLATEQIYNALGKACQTAYHFDRFTVVRVNGDSGNEGVIVRVIGQRDVMGEGFRFRLEDGLMGWVIKRNRPLLLSDLEEGDFFRPRYSREERSNYGLRSFLGVPISFQNQVFGALSIECKRPDFYTPFDESTFSLLGQYAALAILATEFGAKRTKEANM